MKDAIDATETGEMLVFLKGQAPELVSKVNDVMVALGAHREALFDYGSPPMTARELRSVRHELRVLRNALDHLDQILGIGAGNG